MRSPLPVPSISRLLLSKLRKPSSSSPSTSPSQLPSPPSSLHRRTYTTTPPSQQNYYTIFPHTLPLGPPPSGPFAIPLRALRTEYLKLQQLVHPDLQHHHHQKPTHSSSSSSSPSSASPQPPPPQFLTSPLLQKAYSTLSDPLLRAEYILSLHPPPPTSSSDPSLLTQILSLSEQLEDAHEARDIPLLERLRDENLERLRREEEGVGRLLEGGDWEGARRGVERWRFWRRLGRSVEGFLEEAGVEGR
ncbi:hypothetical protein DFH27DRAFT_598968 [Peziza echinospora]|nr:hypothetical protein DFH27DRAFT_598968 [Peziza echinospora]